MSHVRAHEIRFDVLEARELLAASPRVVGRIPRP